MVSPAHHSCGQHSHGRALPWSYVLAPCTVISKAICRGMPAFVYGMHTSLLGRLDVCLPVMYTLQGHGKPCRAQLWAMRWRACSMQSTGSSEAGLLGHAYTRVCHAIKPVGPAGCVPASHVCTSQLHVCSACVRAV